MNKVKEISKTFFEVNEHKVKIQTRAGRRLIICDCKNHTKFCGESPICSHKSLVLEYIFTKKIREKLDKLIPVYENWNNLQLPLNPSLMLDDLKNLRKIANGNLKI